MRLEWSCAEEDTLCAQEAGFVVRSGMQCLQKKRIEIMCDARMVARTVVITCSEWITCMVMFLCSTCLCR